MIGVTVCPMCRMRVVHPGRRWSEIFTAHLAANPRCAAAVDRLAADLLAMDAS